MLDNYTDDIIDACISSSDNFHHYSDNNIKYKMVNEKNN